MKQIRFREALKEALAEELASLKTPDAPATTGNSSDDQKSRAESLRQQILDLNKDAEQLSQKMRF